MVSIGYKSSSGQTRIPKFSPVFKSWCKGQTKPILYSGKYVLRLEIHYIDTLDEIDNPRRYIVDFDYNTEEVRDYVRNSRDLAITNLMLDGLTVIKSTIRLIANPVSY